MSNKTEKKTLLQRLNEKFSSFGSRKKKLSDRQLVSQAVSESNNDQREERRLSQVEQSMIKNVIEFRDLRASDVMVPRSDIISVEMKADLNEVRDCIIACEHTRLPVFESNLDNVKGFIHTKDVIPYLGTSRPFTVQQILRDILFVSPSIKLVDLLLKMRMKRIHMALVLDEYGGIDGLVTIENIMEEIVGEIEDEHDVDEELLLQHVTDNVWIASGRISMEELEHETGVSMTPEETEGDFETLGGYIFHRLGYVPKTGEEISHPTGVFFEVLEADPRRVKKIRIHLPIGTSMNQDSHDD